MFLPILYLSCLLHAVAPGRSLYQDHTLSSADAAIESEEDENWQEKEASRTHSVKFNTAETESDPNKEVSSPFITLLILLVYTFQYSNQKLLVALLNSLFIDSHNRVWDSLDEVAGNVYGG